MPDTATTSPRLSLRDTLATELATLRDQGLERTLRVTAHRHGAVVRTPTGEAVDFSANDYLGLASDPRLAAAANAAMRAQGVGAAAARLIAGNNPEHEALETAIAHWFDAESALCFSSGFAANVGIVPALVGRGDVIFSDALNHASLIDGCRLSRATVVVYPHADATALARLLAAHRPAAQRALIVSDGIFSMDGDRAPLAELVALAEEWNAWTYVDDAHAVGAIGADGRGLASDDGLHGRVDISVGTLGKSFGAAGAFVCGAEVLTRFLLNRARSFVFSTAMLPAQAAAAREALRISIAEPERRRRLAANAALLRDALHAADVGVMGREPSHIVPVHVGGARATMELGAELARQGFLVGAVRPPTVAEGTSRLRITLSAAHDAGQIHGLARAIASVMSQVST